MLPLEAGNLGPGGGTHARGKAAGQHGPGLDSGPNSKDANKNWKLRVCIFHEAFGCSVSWMRLLVQRKPHYCLFFKRVGEGMYRFVYVYPERTRFAVVNTKQMQTTRHCWVCLLLGSKGISQ